MNGCAYPFIDYSLFTFKIVHLRFEKSLTA